MDNNGCCCKSFSFVFVFFFVILVQMRFEYTSRNVVYVFIAAYVGKTIKITNRYTQTIFVFGIPLHETHSFFESNFKLNAYKKYRIHFTLNFRMSSCLHWHMFYHARFFFLHLLFSFLFSCCLLFIGFIFIVISRQ